MKWFSRILIMISMTATFLFSDDKMYDPLLHSVKNNTGTSKEFGLFTLPKSGTHLMIPLLEKLTKRKNMNLQIFPNLPWITDYQEYLKISHDPTLVQIHWLNYPIPISLFQEKMEIMWSTNQFFVCHVPFSRSMENQMRQRDAVVFFILRDPRDALVSLMNHFRYRGCMLFDEAWFLSLSTDEQIKTLLVGTDWYNSYKTIFNRYIPWRHSTVCCTLEYEKLMGPAAGVYGKEEQIIQLRKIADALQIKKSDAQLMKAFDEVYGTGMTFYKGVAGQWKEHFNEENKQLFKDLLGDVLITLGYEKDYNW